MSLTNEDIAHVVELFEGLGSITTRKMMGGVCLYHEGVIFAIVTSDGTPRLKAKGALIQKLESVGCTQWTETRKDGKLMKMPYWTLPEDAQDDPEIAVDWARDALHHLG